MVKLNENYLNLKESYLFSDIAKRVAKFTEENPEKKVIKLGIGDVTKPLTKDVIEALHSGVEDMAKAETFKGYGPEQGYEFLRTAIKDYYKRKNVNIELDEIFVSDGAKSDTGNITDLFSEDNIIMIPDPVYPVYVDTNIMNGRKIVYLDANKENNFLPMPDENKKADIIYICSPNNPTGACYNREQLKIWVDYAIKNNALILFDSAYECFVSDKSLPTSIYEIEGARKCAIEFCSLSKTAGFTGTRCGYTIVGERGVGLSGGQKQRISLARALLKEPSILILDDTTSALDMETEHLIQKNLKELGKDCTKILIAYRISSIIDADLILVLDKGEVVEQGTHEELLAKKGYYYSVFHHQYGDFREGRV